MQDPPGVLQFTLLPHRRRLAVTLGRWSLNPERRYRALRQQFAELFANRHQLGKILIVLSRIRILNHRNRSCPPRRRINFPPHLRRSLLDKRRNLSNPCSDFGLHRSPSSPLISDAFNPPTRPCARAQVVSTSASKISPARGPHN